MLKGPDQDGRKVESYEHTEKFWYFLKNKGISAHRSAIVKAVAEKAATFFRDIVSHDFFAFLLRTEMCCYGALLDSHCM